MYLFIVYSSQYSPLIHLYLFKQPLWAWNHLRHSPFVRSHVTCWLVMKSTHTKGLGLKSSVPHPWWDTQEGKSKTSKKVNWFHPVCPIRRWRRGFHPKDVTIFITKNKLKNKRYDHFQSDRRNMAPVPINKTWYVIYAVIVWLQLSAKRGVPAFPGWMDRYYSRLAEDLIG